MEKARILIVEDEELVALGIQSYLDDNGRIDSAIRTTGDAAIEAIPEFAPDLILMDISLSGAMSGIEAAKAITDSFRVPIIFLTAYSDQKTIEDAKVAQPYGFIFKPFDERNLLSTIEAALAEASRLGDSIRTEELLDDMHSEAPKDASS
jgi:DNA-binding NarL/FixJ family response regulator